MRCRTNFRTTATLAFLKPMRFASLRPQLFSAHQWDTRVSNTPAAWTYRPLQQAMLTNEFFGPATEEVATGFANDQAMVLEQATDLVLEIALDLN